ncbi:MAG TPA: AAA family ATPase, partial [Allocoleopsis sp.]
MEYLEITNFLTIKQANLEIKKITLLIGEQATGKSLIAKILYFFQDLLYLPLINYIGNSKDQREFKRIILQKFEQFFPRYAYQKQEFTIIYKLDDIFISISQEKTAKNHFKLNCNYGDKFKTIYHQIKRFIEKKAETAAIDMFKQNYQILNVESVAEANFSKYFQKSFFIPANRSFFANLQKNVFGFLANNIEIDPFIRDFGSSYESSKRIYTQISNDQNNQDSPEKKLFNKIQVLISKIIAGEYIYEDGEDWIMSNNMMINLIHTSSGQQEALPMLLTLGNVPYMDDDFPIKFLIEEPEAHLFPYTQKELISLFSLLYNQMEVAFFITTHSPYILTALNNLIMAGNLIDKLDKNDELIDYLIDYEDVSAYTINNGIL